MRALAAFALGCLVTLATLTRCSSQAAKAGTGDVIPAPLLHSGTRLKIHAWKSADGAEIPKAALFYDSQLQADCGPQYQPSTGAWLCAVNDTSVAKADLAELFDATDEN